MEKPFVLRVQIVLSCSRHALLIVVLDWQCETGKHILTSCAR